jgi:hypothetical protein
MAVDGDVLAFKLGHVNPIWTKNHTNVTLHNKAKKVTAAPQFFHDFLSSKP